MNESRDRAADGRPSEPSPEQLPRRFERFTLVKHLARGGMGEVFLATSGGIEGAERPAVVKIIRREHADDRSFLARFFDEARIQSQLEHPGVVRVLEAATDASGKPYVVVEYVEGRNLGEVRNRASQLGVRITWPDALAIGVTLTDALAHVHERTDAAGKPLEIAHRDLSPQNVMVGYAGDVKVIDFGTARGENRRCHTVSGIVFAKPGYVAPEVANNTPGSAPSDIYAFGVMLWELIAGRRFLTGDSAEHMAAVAAGERSPTPLAQLVDAPRDLDALLSRLTAQNPESRPSAREAVVELVRLLSQAPSLPDGERSVRARVAHLMQRLYPAEPARSRGEFARLLAGARKLMSLPPPRPAPPALPPPSPLPEPEVDPNVLPGTRYRLGREVGRGAMGVVYEAYHLDLGRTLALKLLPAETAQGSERGERFRSEARAVAALDHPNLVRLHDFGTSRDGRLFYAMELLEGEPLDRNLSREKGMDWREAVRLGIEACSALEAAHRAGVIHRDIKPANLFLTKSSTLKLLDFGVAKRISEIDRPETESGGGALVVVGTPEYMAPEQISGGAADPRSDLYALGAVLYELVTGRLPHVASSTVALLDAKLRFLPEPPQKRAPQRGLPNMVDSTIQRALRRDPEERFQSAAEMRDALEAALREPETDRRRRRRVALCAVATLMLALGGSTVVGALRPEVRARAAAMTQPIVERIAALRGGAPKTDTALAANAAPDTAAPEPSALENAAEKSEPGEPAAQEEASGDEQGSSATGEASDESSDETAQATDESPGDEAAPDKAGSDEKAEFSAEVPASKPSGDEVETKVAAAQELMKSGSKVKGLNQLRRLGKNHGKDPRVLKALTQAAIEMKGWGEAHRIARHWASVDPSEEARITYARMQRAIGKGDQAIKTLNQLLSQHPGCEEARAMLASWRSARLAMKH